MTWFMIMMEAVTVLAAVGVARRIAGALQTLQAFHEDGGIID